jgi:hypothetical protein
MATNWLFIAGQPWDLSAPRPVLDMFRMFTLAALASRNSLCFSTLIIWSVLFFSLLQPVRHRTLGVLVKLYSRARADVTCANAKDSLLVRGDLSRETGDSPTAWQPDAWLQGRQYTTYSWHHSPKPPGEVEVVSTGPNDARWIQKIHLAPVGMSSPPASAARGSAPTRTARTSACSRTGSFRHNCTPRAIGERSTSISRPAPTVPISCSSAGSGGTRA